MIISDRNLPHLKHSFIIGFHVKLFKKWNWIIGTGVYVDDIEAMVAARQAKIQDSVADATAEMENQIETIKTDIQNNIERVVLLIIVVTAIVLALVLAGSYFFAQYSVTKQVKRIIDRLNDGADQVTAASGQITASSQSLAEGSSEQAAALEQSSASLEEMASMTKQNADNASQADRLMKQARQVVDQANRSMADLTSSMEEMLSQAGYMKDTVDQLITLVGGSTGVVTRQSTAGTARPLEKTQTKRRSPQATAAYRQVPVARKQDVNPEQIIPLEADDFKAF